MLMLLCWLSCFILLCCDIMLSVIILSVIILNDIHYNHTQYKSIITITLNIKYRVHLCWCCYADYGVFLVMLSVIRLSIIILNDTQHIHTQHNNIEFCYAECLVFTVIIVVMMLTVIMLNDSTITLNITLCWMSRFLKKNMESFACLDLKNARQWFYWFLNKFHFFILT